MTEDSRDMRSRRPCPDWRSWSSTLVIELNCLGQRCPLPVIALARAIPDVAVGTVIRVLADDPAAAIDIPAWCRMRQQEFVGSPYANAFEVRRVS